MSEIEIPEAAIKATYKSIYTDSLTNKSTRAVLELGGPIVLAAELRRLAARLEARFVGGPIDRESAAYMLRARADELDPRGGRS